MEKKEEKKLWRQGDVLIENASLPAGAELKSHCVLAHGEVTGHMHQVVEPEGKVELYEKDGTLYLKVIADEAIVTHEEHGPITLKRGTYKAWIQREYVPGRLERRVID